MKTGVEIADEIWPQVNKSKVNTRSRNNNATVRRTKVLNLQKSNNLKSDKPVNVGDCEDLKTRSVNIPSGSA